MKLGSGVNPGFASTDLNCIQIKEIVVRLNSHDKLEHISAHLRSQTLLTWVCVEKSENFVAQQIESSTTHLTAIQFAYRIYKILPNSRVRLSSYS